MTWAQFHAACQLLAEERVGWQQRAAQDREDAEVLGLKNAIRRQR